MTQKMGRPTDDPKNRNFRVRMTDADIERLDYCAKETGLTRAAVIRQSVKKFYEGLKKAEENE